MFAHIGNHPYGGAVDKARTWAPRGTAIAAFVLYALAAPSGWYWLDSAELSAAAVNLGSSHPTGFPLYVVLAKAASLLPVGELAFRINLFSALCASLAVLWLARLVSEVCREDAAGIVGGVAAGGTLAVSLTFFRNATVAEVYAPTAAMIALALLLLNRLLRDGDSRHGLLLTIVCGLGLATHTSFLLAGPVIVVFFLVRIYQGARWPMVAPLLLVGMMAATYLYLPVRSSTGRTAAVDWGHPRTASAFVDHVTGARIRRGFSADKAASRQSAAAQMRSTNPEVVRHNANTFAKDISEQLLLILVATIGGVVWLARRRRTRWLLAALAVVVVGDVIYSFWINPMGLVDLQNGVPTALGLCGFAGVGVAWFARAFGRAAPFGGAVVAFILVVTTGLVSWQPVFAASSGDLPRRWSEAAMDAMPPRGIVLSTTDSVSSGLLYLSAVEGARPDVTALVQQHADGDWQRSFALLAQNVRDPSEIVHLLASESIWTGIAKTRRPLGWEIGGINPPWRHRLVAGAPIAQVYPPGAAAKHNNADIGDAQLAIAHLFDHDSARDRSARRVHAIALTALGQHAFRMRDRTRAAALFEHALRVHPGNVKAMVNIGVLAAARKDLDKAIELTETALRHNPVHIGALVNLARYHLRKKDREGAAPLLRRALRLNDKRADAWSLLALIDLQAHNYKRACKHIAKAVAIDPRNRDLHDIMRQGAAQICGYGKR